MPFVAVHPFRLMRPSQPWMDWFGHQMEQPGLHEVVWFIFLIEHLFEWPRPFSTFLFLTGTGFSHVFFGNRMLFNRFADHMQRQGLSLCSLGLDCKCKMETIPGQGANGTTNADGGGIAPCHRMMPHCDMRGLLKPWFKLVTSVRNPAVLVTFQVILSRVSTAVSHGRMAHAHVLGQGLVVFFFSYFLSLLSSLQKSTQISQSQPVKLLEALPPTTTVRGNPPSPRGSDAFWEWEGCGSETHWVWLTWLTWPLARWNTKAFLWRSSGSDSAGPCRCWHHELLGVRNSPCLKEVRTSWKAWEPLSWRTMKTRKEADCKALSSTTWRAMALVPSWETHWKWQLSQRSWARTEVTERSLGSS